MEAGMSASTASPLTGELRRIAIICPSWVGDSVMATPVYRAVRAATPDAHTVAFARPGVDALLRGTPWFNELIALDMRGVAGPIRAARLMRSSSFDAALLLPNSFRSALTARLAGVPRRIGYARDGRGFLLTHARPVEPASTPLPTIDYYARLGAFAIGKESIEPHPELFVTPEEEEEAASLLKDLEGPFVLLNPGANKAEKRWPADRFAAVANVLHNRRELRIAVTGAPAERDVLDAVIGAAHAPIVDLASRGINLSTLKVVVRRATLMITNDTGPRHIAAALGTPVVTLFGPTDHRWTTLPDVRERRLLAEPFLPEELIADKHPKACAISRIAVEDVVAAAEALLDADQPSADARR
jgi:heptosyltransferase-2